MVYWLWFIKLRKCLSWNTSLLLLSHSVMPDSLWPRGLQHARLPCPPPSPRACSDSCPLSQWCHPTISSSVVPFSPAFSLSQHQGLFQWFSSPHKEPRVLEFQLQHQSFRFIEYSALISCRTDWFDLLPVQGTLKSLFQHHSSKRLMLWRSGFLLVQFSRTCLITEKP